MSVPEPVPALETTCTAVRRARFPVIDAHNHLRADLAGEWGDDHGHLIDLLDRVGVAGYVDLDGGWGEDALADHLERFKAAAPDRVNGFGGVDWSARTERGDRSGDWAARRLAAQARRAAEGVKIWRGLTVCDQHDRLVAVDDPRLDPMWAAAGELNLPVVVDVADPGALFWPLDARNERRGELEGHPDWHVPSPPHPSFRTIVEAMARVVERHRATIFVGARVGWYAENLDWVEALMDRCPNFSVDIGARIAELGRQPNRARRFFVERSDRILFGLDLGPDVDFYRINVRFLETVDDNLAYSTEAVPPQGRWRIHGLGLPAEVLARVYHDDAARVLGWGNPILDKEAS